MNYQLIWQKVLDELWFLIKAPAINPELLWIVSPLILMTLVMTLYYGVYIREKLGYGTSLGNSVLLFFVGLDLLRTVYHYTYPPSFRQLMIHYGKVLLIMVILAEAYLLARGAFKHAIPKNIMFKLASPLSVNLQAYILAVIVYNLREITGYTLMAAVLLFLMMFAILRTIQEIQHLVIGHHNEFFRKIKNKMKRKISGLFRNI